MTFLMSTGCVVSQPWAGQGDQGDLGCVPLLRKEEGPGTETGKLSVLPPHPHPP